MDRGAWRATVHRVARVGHGLATKPSNHQWLIRTTLVGQMAKCLPTMWETRVPSLGWDDPLEKEMADNSCTLAWKIPWTEEPGRLQSMGSQSRTRLNDFTLCIVLAIQSWARQFRALSFSFSILKTKMIITHNP